MPHRVENMVRKGEIACYKQFLLFSQCFLQLYIEKVTLQILGQKVYKNTEKSFLYSKSLLIFIHKTPVVESHPTIREISDLLRSTSTPTGNTVYFYMSSSLIYILKTHWMKLQKLCPMKTL